MTENGAADLINVVLTFTDETGRRWLAGALMGPLVAEHNDGRVVTVEEMKDRAFMLARFTVVDEPVGHER